MSQAEELSPIPERTEITRNVDTKVTINAMDEALCKINAVNPAQRLALNNDKRISMSTGPPPALIREILYTPIIGLVYSILRFSFLY